MKHQSILLALLLAFSPALSLAHEGHNEGLAQVQAVHGGIPKEGKLFHIEALTEGNSIKIYILPHKGDSIDPKDVIVKAEISFPKGTKKKSLQPEVKAQPDHFAIEADLAGVNRFELKLNTQYKGKSQTFKLNIEPKG